MNRSCLFYHSLLLNLNIEAHVLFVLLLLYKYQNCFHAATAAITCYAVTDKRFQHYLLPASRLTGIPIANTSVSKWMSAGKCL